MLEKLLRYYSKAARAIRDEEEEYMTQTSEVERDIIERLGHNGWQDQLSWIRKFGPERALLLRQYPPHSERFKTKKMSWGEMRFYSEDTASDIEFYLRLGNSPETLNEFMKLGIGFGWIESLNPHLGDYKAYGPNKGERYSFDYTFFGRVHGVGFRGFCSGLMRILNLSVLSVPTNRTIEDELAVTVGFTGNEAGNKLFLDVLYESKGCYIERRVEYKHPI